MTCIQTNWVSNAAMVFLTGQEGQRNHVACRREQQETGRAEQREAEQSFHGASLHH